MSNIKTCGRCDSKIVEETYNPLEQIQFCRGLPDNSYECNDIHLCTMCADELWEFVFETEIDRSDKVDPISLQKLSESVERHIDELQSVLNQLEGLE